MIPTTSGIGAASVLKAVPNRRNDRSWICDPGALCRSHPQLKTFMKEAGGVNAAGSRNGLRSLSGLLVGQCKRSFLNFVELVRSHLPQ